MAERRKGDRIALIPADLFIGLNLPDGARVLFEELCGHANSKDLCWPGLDRLANRLNVGRRTIQNRMRTLERLGLVECFVGFVEIGTKIERRHLMRVCRDRSKLAEIANRNLMKLASRRIQFGEFGKRGASRRHRSVQEVKLDTSRGEIVRPYEVKAASLKQSNEQIQRNSGPDAPSQRTNAGYETPSTNHGSDDLSADIAWDRWAEWLVKSRGWSIDQAHCALMQWVENTQNELGLTFEDAALVVNSILKTLRHAFPGGPSFDELLSREKAKRST